MQTHPLFTREERWGWQFVPVPDPSASPLSDAQPQWVEPTPLNIGLLERNLEDHKTNLQRPLAGGIVCCLVGLGLVLDDNVGVGLLLLCAGGGMLWYYASRIIGVRGEIDRAKRQWDEDRTRRWYDHQRELRDWQAAIEEHNEKERHRYQHDPLWYPIQPSRPLRRIDVYGGNSDGWASLLTTAGTSLMASGHKLVLVDLSGDDVGTDLRGFSQQQNLRCSTSLVRCEGDGPDVLGGLSDDDVVEALALSIRDTSGNPDDQFADSHALDSEVIDLAVSCLEPPYSLRRVSAALTVLARPQDAQAADELHERELAGLWDKLDTLRDDTELRRRLSVILAWLRPLRRVDVDPNADELISGHAPVDFENIVLAHGAHQQTTALQRVLFNALTMRLRSISSDGRMLIVAGADQLSHLSLEQISRLAARAGIRLVLMFKHLRGSVSRVLGGDGSAAVFMRLGNFDEATAAAQFIGHEHRFLLSQLTHTVGQTLTTTTGDTVTDQYGVSAGESTSRNVSRTWGDGWLPNTSIGDSSSSTWSRSRSQAWAQTRSVADAQSDQSGQTVSRAYEFTVEPTELQSLPLTAFVAVARNGHDNLVVAGDCNPGIALLDRVSSSPYRQSAGA